VVRVQNRDHVQKHLAEANIGTGIHYPIPLHLQKAYSALGYTKGDFAVSERVAAEILSLPMYPGLTYGQQDRIAQQVLNFVCRETSLESSSSPSAHVASLATQDG
jgi:dTDP-4-amino-4,6-dideoxygalactose transaminase